MLSGTGRFTLEKRRLGSALKGGHTHGHTIHVAESPVSGHHHALEQEQQRARRVAGRWDVGPGRTRPTRQGRLLGPARSPTSTEPRVARTAPKPTRAGRTEPTEAARTRAIGRRVRLRSPTPRRRARRPFARRATGAVPVAVGPRDFCTSGLGRARESERASNMAGRSESSPATNRGERSCRRGGQTFRS